MHKIFVSYSHADGRFTARLIQELQRLEVTGFSDKHDLAAGSALTGQIRELIEKADAVVVIMSQNATRSAMVPFEIGAAESFNKRIIPVLAPGESRDSAGFLQLADREWLSADGKIEEVAARIAAAVRGTSVSEGRAFLRPRSLVLARVSLAILVLLAVVYAVQRWMIPALFRPAGPTKPVLAYSGVMAVSTDQNARSEYQVTLTAHDPAINVSFCIEAPKNISSLSEPRILNPSSQAGLGVEWSRVSSLEDCFTIRRMDTNQHLMISYSATALQRGSPPPILSVKNAGDNFLLRPASSKPPP